MRYVSIVFFLLGIAFLPFWPYSSAWNWRLFPSVFCFFVAFLTLLVSVFAKRGSNVWKHRGQG